MFAEALAILAAAAALHWAIGRTTRRIPVWIARRRGDAIGSELPGRRLSDVAGVALRSLLWIAVFVLLADRIDMLHAVRDAVAKLVAMSLDAPLLVQDGHSYTGLDLLRLPVLLAAVWLAASGAAWLLKTRVLAPAGVESGLREAAAAGTAHPAVRRDPRPHVELRRFGESALDFELLVWTCDPRNQQKLVSDLNFRVLANLAQHGIQVPFPQRDLHLRSPQLERLLDAATRRVAPDDVPEAGPHDGVPEPIDDSALEPAEWSDTELAAVAARLHGPGGVPILDRRRLLARHPRSFVGREAVDWLMGHEGLTRDEATALGQRLVERGMVHHVLDEHGFRDGHYFYRFRTDDEAGSGSRRSHDSAS